MIQTNLSSLEIPGGNHIPAHPLLVQDNEREAGLVHQVGVEVGRAGGETTG